jgi:ribosomal protein L20A (L18A)
MKNTPIFLILTAALLVLSACAPVPVEQERPPAGETNTGEIPSPEAALMARLELIERLAVPEETVGIVSVSQAEWPDPCLGIPNPEELCAQVITPGYRVELDVAGETYAIRTNLDGSEIRMERSDPTERAVEAAKKHLASQLRISPDQIDLMQVSQVDWPDGCLGLPGPGEACILVITPGYRIELMAEGETYVYRTDLEGEIVRQERSEPSDDAVEAATEHLASQLRISPDRIEVVQVSQVDWPDGCLGLPGPGEACILVITPGYRIELMAEGETYVYRTDLEGEIVRQERSVPVVVEPTDEVEPPEEGAVPVEPPEAGGDAVEAAIAALARETGLGADQIRVVSVEAVDWRDGCLEVHTPGVACTLAIVPGYRIILEAGGQEYEVRTDRSGSQVIVLDEPASPGGPGFDES